MPDFDLDQYKTSWQQQEVLPKYDSTEILKMLNKKSRNYVKYILWISIVEFFLILAVSLYYSYQGNDGESLIHILEKMQVKMTPEILNTIDVFYNIMKYLSIIIVLFFVIKFYLNYKKINVESNLKKFIQQIIVFKKTVNRFILINILFLLVMTLAMGAFVTKVISQQNIEMDNPTFVGFILGFLISLILSVGLVILYYRLVYGIIIRRLSKNLEQLKEIEESE